ncbi:CBS domain-containing protein [Peterkaempfera griseoplana]|uniref:CBS domain-containing protein n=1 Tax=Peterkaempfera griseoplana TaxID=66896 RepID=UPI0006E2BF78|nr:CBS domain-containing protein [Peterkaempfera griseoplana]
MHHRTVADVMTRSVVTAHPDTPFKELADLLDSNAVSAVPVVDSADHLVGLVSEADLLHKEASLPDLQGRTHPSAPTRAEQSRVTAETAQGLMAADLVSAHPEWTVPEAARVMEQHHVRRLPVVDEVDRLVGIVSRTDLLRVFLRSDTAIREEIVDDVLQETLWLDTRDIAVEVEDGVVTLRGGVENKSMIPLLARLCWSVDGVVAVHTALDYRLDDMAGHGRDPGSTFGGRH